MKGPYTYRVTDGLDGLVLGEGRFIGLLSEAERRGHLSAAEWISSGILESTNFVVIDANDKTVRAFVVYDRDGTRLANSLVRERLS